MNVMQTGIPPAPIPCLSHLHRLYVRLPAAMSARCLQGEVTGHQRHSRQKPTSLASNSSSSSTLAFKRPRRLRPPLVRACQRYLRHCLCEGVEEQRWFRLSCLLVAIWAGLVNGTCSKVVWHQEVWHHEGNEPSGAAANSLQKCHGGCEG